MQKVLVITEKIMDYIAKNVLLVVFTIMFLVGIAIKAMYNFDDSPYFEFTTMYDIVAFVVVLGLVFFVYKGRDYIQKHINYKICFLLFIFASVLYIWLVPLIPFSDMEAIYKGAINFAKLDWSAMLSDDYWSIFPGNIRLTVFWGILIFPFPKTLITFKVLNALMLYVIIVLTRLIAYEYRVKYYNVVYLFVLTFCSLFLFVNSVYFDIPLILLCLLGLYLYKKYNQLLLAFASIGVACYLRKSGMIFMLAMIIIYLFENKGVWKSKECIKKLGVLVGAVVLCMGINKGATTLVNDVFLGDDYKKYPSWNIYYMAINETEFGFQDNNFSYDRTAQDVIDRIKEYGPVRLTKILTKKTFWLWTQGTYQAQRYAFGNDVVNVLDKFEYETFATKYLLNDQQVVRKVLNAFMRAQYYTMFGLMILTISKKKNVDKFRIFYYIIIATFLAMIIHELKSRYILHLTPFMIIMAGDYFEQIEIHRLKGRGIEEG